MSAGYVGAQNFRRRPFLDASDGGAEDIDPSIVEHVFQARPLKSASVEAIFYSVSVLPVPTSDRFLTIMYSIPSLPPLF
jgi:hypothetical protein